MARSDHYEFFQEVISYVDLYQDGRKFVQKSLFSYAPTIDLLTGERAVVLTSHSPGTAGWQVILMVERFQELVAAKQLQYWSHPKADKKVTELVDMKFSIARS